MHEIKSAPLKKIIIFFVCLLFVYVEAVGVYHSLSKHSKEDGYKSIYIPPFAWFRSIEIWEHTDIKNTDWRDELRANTKNCLVILTQYGKADPAEINKTIENQKGQLKKYPKEKYDYVKSFCKDYITYYQTAQKEFNQWVIKFFNNGNVRYQKSKELQATQSSLSKYNIDELNNSIKHSDSLFVLLYNEYYRMKQQYIKANPEGKKKFLEVIFRKDNINLQNIKTAYKNIFDEEIKM